MVEPLLIARNPDPDSSLPFLVRIPIGEGIVLRTRETWPRMAKVYCHRHDAPWPEEPDLVEEIALRSCARRGAAIDVVADRTREARSQFVLTKARGREMIFWQTARVAKAARPNVDLPTARAAGLTDLTIVVDTRERYAWKFSHQQASTVARALPVGDYGVFLDEDLVAVVERKSLADLTSSLTSGKLAYRLADLAGMPSAASTADTAKAAKASRSAAKTGPAGAVAPITESASPAKPAAAPAVPVAAVVVEDRYSSIFKLDHVRPALVAEMLGECQARWPSVPIIFAENRALAQEWTFRFLGAALHERLSAQAAEQILPG